MQNLDLATDCCELTVDGNALRELVGIEIMLIGGGEIAGTAY